jgi:hypothetical protein
MCTLYSEIKYVINEFLNNVHILIIFKFIYTKCMIANLAKITDTTLHILKFCFIQDCVSALYST